MAASVAAASVGGGGVGDGGVMTAEPGAGGLRRTEARELHCGRFVVGEADQIAFLRDEPGPAVPVVEAARRGAHPPRGGTVSAASGAAGGAAAAGGEFAAEADAVAGAEGADAFSGGDHPAGNLLNAAVCSVAAGVAADPGMQDFDQHIGIADSADGRGRERAGYGGGNVFGGCENRRNGEQERGGDDDGNEERFLFHEFNS